MGAATAGTARKSVQPHHQRGARHQPRNLRHFLQTSSHNRVGMTDSLRKVAILGGVRIPFARSNTAYVDLTNLDMLTAALKALVDKFALRGQQIGEVAAGAGVKHTRDARLGRGGTLRSRPPPPPPPPHAQRASGTTPT